MQVTPAKSQSQFYLKQKAPVSWLLPGLACDSRVSSFYVI